MSSFPLTNPDSRSNNSDINNISINNSNNVVNTDTNEIIEECEKCVDEMKKSLKPYNRHFILCLPQGIVSFLDTSEDKNWPSHIEEIPIVKYFNDTKNKYENDSIKLKLTACDFNPNVDAVTDAVYDVSISIIIYPENVIITIPYNSTSMENIHIENLFQWCYSTQSNTNTNRNDILTTSTLTPIPRSLRELYNETNSNVIINNTPWDKLILVCVHMARDKRCGRAGPLILSELQKQLDNLTPELSETESELCRSRNNIQICGSSHIGGHKYAGVLIVYPENQWYGRISKATITKLLNVLLKRDMDEEEKTVFIEKCYRGHGYCSKNTELF